MAKHFKEDATESTAVMSRTKQREAEPPRVNTEGTTSLPYGQAATYRAAYSEAAPTSEFFVDDMPARGGIYAFLRGLLLLFAWLLRICAVVMVLIVLANALALPVFRQQLATIVDTITSFCPWRGLGLLEIDTPFGGTFRGDLALVSLFLFILDWLLCVIRARLR